MFRALKHPGYRRWATADFVSVTGAWMQNLGLNWLVLTMTGSASLLGLSLFFQAVPALLLASWAGSLADRLPAKRILYVTQTLHALLAAALTVVAWTGAPLAALYAIAVCTGAVTVFDGPALGRFGSQLVPREHLSNALSLGSIISSGGRILGMSLAGVIAGLAGESWLFAINAVTFIGVLIALKLIRSDSLYPLESSTAERTGAMAGLRYVASHRPMIVVFLLSFVLSSLGRNYQVTMAAMSNGPLGTGAVGYSVLSVVFAVGTIVGGFLAASRKQLSLRLLLGAALAISLLQLVSGAAPILMLFAAALLPIAAGAVVIDTTMSTRIQLDSDEDMRGRVLSAKSMVTAASGAVGGPILGWMCEQLGAGNALHIAGIVTAVTTAFAWLYLSRMPQRRAMPTDTKWAQLVTTPNPAQPAADSGLPGRLELKETIRPAATTSGSAPSTRIDWYEQWEPTAASTGSPDTYAPSGLVADEDHPT